MDIRTILAKLFILVVKTRLIDSTDQDDLIRTILGLIKTDTRESNAVGVNSVGRLKDYILKLLEEREPILPEVVIPVVSIILENDPKLVGIIKDAISSEQDDSTVKRVIASHIKTLNNYYKEHLAIEILSRVSYDLKFNRNKIPNFGAFLKETLAELEPLTAMTTSIKDPAMVNEIDFENEDSVNVVFNDVKNVNNNTSIYRLGWHALNRMLQGGVRRGESANIAGALQHNYKTGMSLSVFAQIASLNTPIFSEKEAEEKRKPLLLRISFEDSLSNNLQFMYQYFKAIDGVKIKPSDFDSLETTEMTKYVTAKLTATGFCVKMIRIDPSQWTYTDVMNKVFEYEAQGYAVHVLMLDYISMLPTTGCDRSGPMGADKRDLVRRIRNFCSARNIAMLTPFQLNTEVKSLLRNGVHARQLLQEVVDGTMYDGSKTIANDLDFEVFIMLVKHNRKAYLAVRRGKHRLPTNIEEDDAFFFLPFLDPHTPLLPDINGDEITLKALPRAATEANDNLLNEIL